MWWAGQELRLLCLHGQASSPVLASLRQQRAPEAEATWSGFLLPHSVFPKDSDAITLPLPLGPALMQSVCLNYSPRGGGGIIAVFCTQEERPRGPLPWLHVCV